MERIIPEELYIISTKQKKEGTKKKEEKTTKEQKSQNVHAHLLELFDFVL